MSACHAGYLLESSLGSYRAFDRKYNKLRGNYSEILKGLQRKVKGDTVTT
jgi:hypothetical protein